MYADESSFQDILDSYKGRRKPALGWRAIIMVEKSDVKYLDATIQRLYHLGIQDVHIFAQAKVRISQRYDHASHQDPAWTTPYRLWRDAMRMCGDVYSSQTDYFLVVRPGIYLWEQITKYCEQTINSKEVAVWCPLTPNRVFPTANIVRPRCHGNFGWCPTKGTSDIEVHHCFVLTGHMLTLMSAYLPPPDSEEIDRSVGSALAYELSRREVPYYFHLPSLATIDSDVSFTAGDFVGTIFDMPDDDMKDRDFLLKPRKR